MGNNNVYSQGLYITPYKIQKPFHIDQNSLNMQNMFGKTAIQTARAQKANQTHSQYISTLQVDHIIKTHYCILDQFQSTSPQTVDPLKQQTNKYVDEQSPQQTLLDRKAKTQPSISKIQSQINMQRFMTRQDSPVKQQNYKPEQSYIQIFQSRLQNKYFKIKN